MIQTGPGKELIPLICQSSRAVVFISVPWSGPERISREVFRVAVAKLEKEFPDHGISFYHLEADEDESSQKWLTSVGHANYAIAGSGSILWVKSGSVISSELNASSIGVNGIFDCTLSVWQHNFRQ